MNRGLWHPVAFISSNQPRHRVPYASTVCLSNWSPTAPISITELIAFKLEPNCAIYYGAYRFSRSRLVFSMILNPYTSTGATAPYLLVFSMSLNPYTSTGATAPYLFRSGACNVASIRSLGNVALLSLITEPLARFWSTVCHLHLSAQFLFEKSSAPRWCNMLLHFNRPYGPI